MKEAEVTGVRVQDSLEYLSETTQQAILVEQTKRFGIASEMDLSSRLQDPQFLGQVWEQAGELERTVIRLFVTSASRGFFSKRSWEREIAKEHRHLSVALTKLRRLGLILTVRKMWSEIGYCMPQEVREQMTMYLLPEASEAFVSLSKTLPYYISAGRGIHLDLFGLLVFIRDNQVPVTQKGTIHRRMSQKMMSLLSLSDEHVKGLVLPPLDQEAREGLCLTVTLDLALRLGLVQMHERRLVIQPSQIRCWLAQSPPERWEQLYDFITQHYLPHGGWWDAFAELMKQVQLDQWCFLDKQLSMLEKAGFTPPDDAKRLILEQWLHLLTGLGWIQLGMDEEHRIFWRWNSLPRLTAEEGWFVDPAGAITIPPLVPLRDVWEISKLCQLQFEGPLIRGELQARMLQTFLSSGGTEQQVMDIIRSACAHPMPEVLAEVLSQWAKTARQIQMEPCFRVRTAHPGFIEEWRQIPDFCPFLTQIISPTDFLIAQDQESALIATLRQFGYEPQVLSHTPAVSGGIGTQPDLQARNGLFLVERPWDGYAVENTFPEQMEGMPEIVSLPKMWTQHFQSYHPQSLRDLFKRATELQLEVEFQQKGKDRLQGTPLDVRVEMGYWMVTMETKTGKNRYRLDDFDRVRIVVPQYLY
ncbi:hypothetical protein [Brevibacillus sp. NRS-1366]|uniref:hypothetical protein n=1 Tax=Brevibacillus sp. NRS-1366 TaxID=3233899 RepID=UPI003D25104E